jgi:hypothetical protein
VPDVHGPLPLEVVRDLLGITRAWYRAAKADMGAGKRLINELEVIGKLFRAALDLARKTQPDTLGHRAAWARAEEATDRLMRLITIETRVWPIVEAAVVRVRRIHPKPREADERRAAERTRR